MFLDNERVAADRYCWTDMAALCAALQWAVKQMTQDHSHLHATCEEPNHLQHVAQPRQMMAHAEIGETHKQGICSSPEACWTAATA